MSNFFGVGIIDEQTPRVICFEVGKHIEKRVLVFFIRITYILFFFILTPTAGNNQEQLMIV